MSWNKIKNFTNVNPRFSMTVFFIVLLPIAFIINDENFIAEAFGILITVFLIEWILNGPKRVIYKTAKTDIDSIKYLFFSRLLWSEGFEVEQNEYLTSADPKVEHSSFDERLANSTFILTKLKIEDYESKFKEYEKIHFDGLNHSAKLLLDDLSKFRNNYFLSLGHIGRDTVIKCKKSSEWLVLNSDIVEGTPKGDKRNRFVLGYCAHNIHDIIENLNNLTDEVSDNKGFRNLFKKIKN